MAFTVVTYNSESELAAVIGGTVVTYPDEQTLNDAIAAAVDPKFVIDKGIEFTLVDNSTLINIIQIIGKGAKFTLIEGTP